MTGASAVEHNSEVWIKYRDSGNKWTFITTSAWKNSVNVVIGVIGILLSPYALKPLNSIEKIRPRMMIATFNGNSSSTIISCYIPINASDETDIITFYNKLSSLVSSHPKHKVLITGGHMNSQIGKHENNKFCLHKWGTSKIIFNWKWTNMH